MADQTASLVVALSAQLTKFEKDMRDAGIMADKAVNDIEQKFSKMNPQISASFFGNFLAQAVTAGIGKLEQLVSNMVETFKQLKTAADYAGISIYQAFATAATVQKLGGAVQDVGKNIESVSLLLDQMKRGEANSLSRLFDANPDFLKGVNRDALDLQGTIAIVGEMIKQAATNTQKFEIARQAGLTRDWVKVLQDVGSSWVDINREAEKTASKIDPAIQKAEILRDTIKAAMQGFADKAASDFWKDTEMMVRLTADGLAALSSATKGGPAENFIDRWRDSAVALNEQLKTIDAQVGKLEGAVPLPKARPQFGAGGGTETADPNKPLAHPAAAAVPAGAGGEDFFERQNSQIEKHIALMNADADAVGKSAGEREQLRTEAELYTALERQGVTSTEAYAEAIYQMSERAGQAAQRLATLSEAQSKINSASQQLGSALSTAFADAIVEGKKLSEVMTSLVKTIEKNIINSLIGGIFNPSPGGGPSPIAGLLQGMFGRAAGGTDFARGGLTLVGESGPELVNLPRGSQVIPNDVLRNGGMGGVTATAVFNVDNRGASVDAVARMAQVINEQQRTFASNVVTVIRKARQGRQI